jgi:hypothetical protein
MGTYPVSKARAGLRSNAVSSESATPLATGPIRAWTRFWFTPADPIGLHVVRLVAGLVFLAWLLPLAGHVDALFGLNGWFDRQAYREAARIAGGPQQPFTWSILYLCGSNTALLTAVYWAAIAVLVLFTAGLWTRLTAILTWLIVASFTASPAFSPDADSLLLILALYLMVGYVLLGLADRGRPLARRLLGASGTFFLGPRPALADVPERKSLGANVALRLLQVHFAIVIFVSGLHKLQFGDWWAGLSLWYPLHPVIEMTPNSAGSPAQIRASLTLLGLAAYAVLAWQISFPAFAWRPRWRPVLVGGAVIGALGCAFLYGVPVFGPVLFAGCLAYVSTREWHRLFAWIGMVPGLRRITPRLSMAAEPLVPQKTR